MSIAFGPPEPNSEASPAEDFPFLGRGKSGENSILWRPEKKKSHNRIWQKALHEKARASTALQADRGGTVFFLILPEQ